METMDFEPVKRLSQDIAKSAKLLSHREARFLVDGYYMLQKYRLAAANQIRSLSKGGEPVQVLVWMNQQSEILESQIKRALDRYSDEHAVGAWAKTIVGIGPVISAGLLAHIDMNPWRCVHNKEKKGCSPEESHGPECHHQEIRTAGQIWRFAGLDPTVDWNKGEKRPWNAELKTLCWKIGESFVKVSNNEHSLYGRIYKERREYEDKRNAAGALADQAKRKLERFNIGKTTDAYKAYSKGILPDGHLHARAKRAAVKLFLAHWFECAYEARHGKPAPLPYVIDHMGHAHHITWRDAS